MPDPHPPQMTFVLTRCPHPPNKFVMADDGTVWEPSIPDDHVPGEALGKFLAGQPPAWFFRRIVYHPGWIAGVGRGWYRTGDTWRTDEAKGWRVVDDPIKDALEVP